jgi:S-adenosylmethionine synthetase
MRLFSTEQVTKYHPDKLCDQISDKVDRSGAYMARKIACDLVDEYELKWCEVQIAYAIGQAKPVSITVDNDKKLNLVGVITAKYDLSPAGIIKALDLKRPIYEKLAGGCHFREV